MKMNSKFFAGLLTAALLLQTMPLNAIGDELGSDTYEEPGIELPADSDATADDTAIETPDMPLDPDEEDDATAAPTLPELPSEPGNDDEPTLPEFPAEPGTDGEPALPELPDDTRAPEIPDEVITESATLPEIEPAVTPDATVALGDVLWQNVAAEGDYLPFTPGMEIDTNRICLQFSLSGVPAAVNVSVDGVIIPTAMMPGNTVFAAFEMMDGHHVLTLTVEGAESSVTETIPFSVIGEGTYPKPSIEFPDELILGESSVISFTCDNYDALSELSYEITLTRQMKLTDITLCDGVVGMYTWHRGQIRLQLKVIDPTRVTENTLATVTIKAPATLPAGEKLDWSVDSAVAIPTANSDIGSEGVFVGNVSMTDTVLPVESKYGITGPAILVSGGVNTFTVTDRTGSPAAGVSLYTVVDGANVLLGVSDENGLVSTDALTAKGDVVIFAEDASTATRPQTFVSYENAGAVDGTPYGIISTGHTVGKKTFTWMSSIIGSAEQAVLLLSTDPSMADAVTVNGTSVVVTYATGKTLNRVNTVTLEELIPGTTYYYTVGDGTAMSEVAAFTAKSATDFVTMTVLGQVAGATADQLAVLPGTADLSLLAGSMWIDADDHAEWEKLLGAFGGTGLITNYTPAELENAVHSAVFGTPAAGYQTYVVGNVFVAAVNYTDDTAALRKNLNLVVKEAKNSGAAWQILTIRETPYSTSADKAASVLADFLPDAAERAGFDFVITGADLNYARTESMRGGVVTEKNGVTYIVAPSLGATAPITSDYDFAYKNDSGSLIYLTISTTAEAITLTAYEVAEDGAVRVIDTCEKTHYVCPDGEHIYRADTTSTQLICDICDATTTRVQATGLMVISKSYYYLENGAYYRGWKTVGGKTYYFKPTTANGEQVIDGHTFYFENHVLVKGAWVQEGAGYKLLWGDEFLVNTWYKENGKTYYLKEDGRRATGLIGLPHVNENGEVEILPYLFDENGALIVGS